MGCWQETRPPLPGTPRQQAAVLPASPIGAEGQAQGLTCPLHEGRYLCCPNTPTSGSLGSMPGPGILLALEGQESPYPLPPGPGTAAPSKTSARRRRGLLGTSRDPRPPGMPPATNSPETCTSHPSLQANPLVLGDLPDLPSHYSY